MGALRAETGPDEFLYVRALQFWRPLYLPVLAVLRVLLIAGAAAYSVRTQPVNQLLLGVGSLVLGVWGIRSILVPGFPPYVTAVDLLVRGVRDRLEAYLSEGVDRDFDEGAYLRFQDNQAYDEGVRRIYHVEQLSNR